MLFLLVESGVFFLGIQVSFYFLFHVSYTAHVLVGVLVVQLVKPRYPWSSCLLCIYNFSWHLQWGCGKSSTSLWSMMVFHWLNKFCQAMYPSLILLIINKERSIINTFGFSTVLETKLNGEGHAKSTEHHRATIGHLVFVNPTTVMVDNEELFSSLPRHSTVPGGLRSSDSCLA